MKKGQITFFIILGIFILMIASVAIYLEKNIDFKQKPKLPEDFNHFIQGCLNLHSGVAVNTIILHAGYLNPPYTQEIIGYNYTLLKKGSQNLVPDINYIHYQITDYISKNFISCIDDFSGYRRQGKQVSYGDMNLSVIFNNNDTQIHLYFPVQMILAGQIAYGNNEYEISYRFSFPKTFRFINDSINLMIANNDNISNLHIDSEEFNVNIYESFGRMLFGVVPYGSSYELLYAVQ